MGVKQYREKHTWMNVCVCVCVCVCELLTISSLVLPIFVNILKVFKCLYREHIVFALLSYTI